MAGPVPRSLPGAAPHLRGAHRPKPPAALPEDRSWAARAEALKRERPAQVAIVFALLALMAMMCGWVAVLIAPEGNVRFDPLFWLLMVPLLVWIGGAQALAAWAVKPLWLILVLAPCLSALALAVAPGRRHAAALAGAERLDTPVAMLVLFGLTTALAVAGLVALRRSSLPGGVRPALFVPPGTPMPGGPPLSEAARAMLMAGSLPFSGALINGVFFSVIASLEPLGPGGTVWPGALSATLMLAIGTLVFRGGVRLARRRPDAAADLRRGWRLGMGCAVVFVLALWAWPTVAAVKLGFSCFMVPVAIAACWFGRSALRALPELAAGA